MAYVTVDQSVVLKTPPNVNSEFPTYTVNLNSTIDPATNKPTITLELPGKKVTGDVAYWQRVRSAGGVPGLNPEQSSLLSEFLRTKFSSIPQINNETEKSYKEWSAEESSAETKPAEPATEANPTAQAPDNAETPAEAAKKPQLTGQADDDSDPNKTNAVDGFGPNDPGQQATIGADGTPEVGISSSGDGLEEVVITSKKRPPPAAPSAGKPGRRLYNPLSKLASYTYNLTLYMVTPDAYKAFVESGRQKIDALSRATPVGQGTKPVSGGAFIVAQSGGINAANSNRMPPSSQNEKVDYFIDNLRFKTLTSTKTTGTSTTAISELSFTITEPYGFSFLSDVKRAAEALKSYSSTPDYKELNNAFRNFFIIGIRFYGYDQDGRLVKGSDARYGNAIDPLGGDALFESFHDIIIRDLKFRIDGRAVQYNVTAASINGQNLLGMKRGRMPTGTRVKGKTVHDALMGELGLFKNLNKNEKDKTISNPPSQKFANEYKIVYLGDAENLIKEAPLTSDADLKKYRWGSTTATTTNESTDGQNFKTAEPTEREFAFNQDTTIISAIETIIKRSTFMEKALQTLFLNAQQPDPEKKNYEQTQKEPAPLRWFNIKPEINEANWDPIIGDWVYKMTYVIQMYDIPSIETPYSISGKKYYGPHKRYNYWFTGKNTEILDMDFNFNYLYYTLMLEMGPSVDAAGSGGQKPGGAGGRESQNPANNSGPGAGGTGGTSGNTGLKSDGGTGGSNPAGTATGGGVSPTSAGVRNPGDRTSALGVGLEAQNSVTTYLNDLSAYSSGRMKILGDPDFLVRDAVSSLNSLYDQFYDTDGFTINAQGGQVFVEVVFKEGKDYDDKTGLQRINENILFIEYPEDVKAVAKDAIVYLLADVDSVFSDGRFEQTLNLILPTFPGNKPAKSSDGGSPATQAAPSQQSPQQTTDTPRGQVADDDSTAKNNIPNNTQPEQQGREPTNLQNLSDAELFNLGYMPDEIEQIRRGG